MAKARTDPEALDRAKEEPKRTMLAIPTKVFSKSQFPVVGKDLFTRLVESGKNEFEAFIILRQIKEIAEAGLKEVEVEIINSMNEKEIMVGTAKISQRSAARKYEYEDAELDRLQNIADETKGLIKARQEFLETRKEEESIDTTTGTVVKKAKLISAGLNLAVTFQK